MDGQTPIRRRIVKKIEDAVTEIANQNLLIPDSPITDWISTGCTILDLAIADQLPGGLPVGRVSHIYGAPSTCKSVLAATILGYCQRTNKIGYYNDVEHTFNPIWATKYGLDHKNKDTFRLSHPETIEELFDVHIHELLDSKDKRKKVSITDTVSALTSEAELKDKLDKGTFGSIAKLMARAFRKYNPKRLSEKDVTLIFIDQTRDNMDGGMFGPKEIVPGGRAKEFYFSVRVYLQDGARVENNEGKIIGTWVKFTITKSKVAPPFRSGRFRILFAYGFDDTVSNLTFLKEFQYRDDLKKVKDKTSPVLFQGEERKISSWTKIVEEEGLEKLLQEDVVKAWRVIYKSEERKPRIW